MNIKQALGPAGAGERSHLTDAQAALLDGLIASRPHASSAQIAALLRARTGRSISPTSVRYRMRRARAAPPPGRYHLTEIQKALLGRLIADGGREVSDAEVARQFALLDGREITARAVQRHRLVVLGLPGPGKGRAWRPDPADLARRVDRERRAKLAGGRGHRASGDTP